MKELTKKQKVDIANAIMENSEFRYENANLRHLRKGLREMLIEMADKVLEATKDN